jgi:hypothetical protein
MKIVRMQRPLRGRSLPLERCNKKGAVTKRKTIYSKILLFKLSVVRWFGTYLIFRSGGSGPSDSWLNYAAFN